MNFKAYPSPIVCYATCKYKSCKKITYSKIIIHILNDSEQGANYIAPYNVEPPNEIDWRELGAVTPVRRQCMYLKFASLKIYHK